MNDAAVGAELGDELFVGRERLVVPVRLHQTFAHDPPPAPVHLDDVTHEVRNGPLRNGRHRDVEVPGRGSREPVTLESDDLDLTRQLHAQELRGSGDLALFEGLDDVARLQVLEVLEPDAALEALPHLAHVVLEPTQRRDLALPDDRALT